MKTIYLILTIILCIISSGAEAQEDSGLYEISATITNKAGDKLENVHVLASNSKNKALTDENGFFKLKAEEKDILILSLQDFEKSNVFIHEGKLVDETIVIHQLGVIEPEENVSVSHGHLPFERITGSVERITGNELSDYPTLSVQEALAGRLSGLTSSYGGTSTVDENFGNSIRNGGVGQVYVDGIPSILVLTPGEVDDIIIAKDYGSSFLYGMLGAPGAMIVNSKTGLPGERSIKFKTRSGVRTPTFIPNTMTAEDYARNYNKALINDGFAPIYTQANIDAYKNGSDPVRNPNNDYYKDLVDGTALYNHITGDFSGGNENVQYFSHLGYFTTDGIESVGEGRTLSRLRTNNNLQIKFSGNGTVNVGIGGSFNKVKEPALSANDAFSTMYNYPANALPYQINDSIYGRYPEYSSNLLVGLAKGSIIEDERRDAYARIGLNFDLGQVIKGMSFEALVGKYTLNFLSRRLDPTVDIAEPVFLEDGTIIFRNYSKGAPDNLWERSGDQALRNEFINANLNYNRDFNENHSVIANLVYSTQKITGSQLPQNDITRNFGLRVNYLLKNKYVLEGNLVNSANRQLSKVERDKINYAAGLAWLAHKESFMKNANWLNFLKLRANFGIQSRRIDQFYLTENQYGSGGAGTFGILGNVFGAGGNVRASTGSDNITAPKQEYLSVGADIQALNHSINGQLNYFKIRNYDLLELLTNVHALISSNSSYIPLINYGDERRTGLDGSISYNYKIRDVKMRLGINAMYNLTYVSKSNSINFPDAESDRNVIGNYGGRILGLESNGIFQNDQEIERTVPQMFGEVKPGDIRYKDHNNDGFIDEKDYHEIGNSPRWDYGINYRVQYRNWTLSAHGDGKLGGSYIENLNWNRRANDYANQLWNSWPVSNDLPRLTTLSNSNNYRNSSFWLKDASYFNFRSLSISFSIPQVYLKKMSIKEFTLSARGKNLFVIASDNERYMPSRNSGYLQHPVLRAFELGVQMSF